MPDRAVAMLTEAILERDQPCTTDPWVQNWERGAPLVPGDSHGGRYITRTPKHWRKP
jgi:hypothetical protein